MSLLVEELFDYAAGNLDGLSGGTGFTGAWSTDASGSEQPAIVTTNLSYSGMSNGSPTHAARMKAWNEGDGASKDHYFTREFNGVPNTVNGAVYWFAWTQASNLAKGGTTFVFNKLTSDIAGANPQVVLGWTSGLVDAKVQSNGQLLYTGSASYVAHNIVMKITMSGVAANPVRVDLYCDVDMTTDPSGWTPKMTSTSWYVPAPITSFTWDTFTHASSGSDDLYYMDNFRIATTSYEAGGNTVPASNTGNFFLLF